ncbi:zinc ribbon domain-containing protein [Streptomyces sp. KLMMK]|uniref:zinc ribbon domain-containing protein n=1 Tax=Streptomyces sp. KLMMK TaxID=3109353 RepID=UPI002FFF7A49
MATAIAVTSADLVLAPLDGRTPSAAVLPPPGEQSLDDALAGMQALVEQCGHVVVLYPSSLAVPHERRLQTIRSVLENGRIALVRVDLPPLGLAVLARQLRQISVFDFGAGVVGSAALLFSHYLYAGALLNSVAKLDHVAVGLKAHAKSWVPGSQFGVLASPAPQLIKIGADGPALAGPMFGTYLTVAQGRIASDWVTSTLAPSWNVQALHQAELPKESLRWWGTGKLVEFVAGIGDTSVLAQLVASVKRQPCPWCGLELIGERCVFCSASLSPHANQQARGSVVSPEAGLQGQSAE